MIMVVYRLAMIHLLHRKTGKGMIPIVMTNGGSMQSQFAFALGVALIYQLL